MSGATALRFGTTLGGWIGNVFGIIIAKWKWFFPLILIVGVMLTNVSELVKTQDYEKFLKEVGGRLFSANHRIGVDAQKIIDQKGIYVPTEKPTSFFTKFFKTPWAIIKQITNLIWNVLIFFWWLAMAVVVAKLLTNNTSAQLGVFFVALVLVFTMNSLYAAYFIYPQIEADTGVKIPFKQKINPFSGVFKMVEAFKTFRPIYEKFSPTVLNASEVNESVVPDGVILV